MVLCILERSRTWPLKGIYRLNFNSKTLFFLRGLSGLLINFQSIHYAINQPVYFSLLSPSPDLTAPSPIRRYCLLFFIALDSDELYLCRGKIDRKKGELVCQCGLFILVSSGLSQKEKLKFWRFNIFQSGYLQIS